MYNNKEKIKAEYVARFCLGDPVHPVELHRDPRHHSSGSTSLPLYK